MQNNSVTLSSVNIAIFANHQICRQL